MGRGGKPFWEQNERVKMGRGVKRGVIGWVDGVVCASPNNCVPFFHSRALRSLSSVDSLSLFLSASSNKSSSSSFSLLLLVLLLLFIFME